MLSIWYNAAAINLIEIKKMKNIWIITVVNLIDIYVKSRKKM